MNDSTADVEPRLRRLELLFSEEAGKQEQFRHDSRNWRTAQSGEITEFNGLVRQQLERVHKLELFQAEHVARSEAARKQLDDLAPKLERIDKTLTGDRVRWGILMWLAGVGGGFAVFLCEQLIGKGHP